MGARWMWAAGAAWLGSSGVVAATGHIGETADVKSYEVRGTVRTERLDHETKAITRRFACRVAWPRWEISLTTLGDAPLKRLVYGTNVVFLKLASENEQATCDGTNFYIVQWSKPPAELMAPIARGDTHTNGNAEIGPGTVPFGSDAVLPAIWYSFASASYLGGRNDASILPLDGITFDDVTSTNLLVSARWKLLSLPPRLPSWIQTSTDVYHDPMTSRLTRSAFAYTNAHFQVVGTTQCFGLLLPRRVRIDYYAQLRKDSGMVPSLFKRLDISVDQVAALTAAPALRPTLPAKARVFVRDRRFWLSNPPVDITVMSSNGWPSEHLLQALYSSRVDWVSRRNDRGLVTSMLIAVCLVPPLALWWFLRSRRRSE